MTPKMIEKNIDRILESGEFVRADMSKRTPGSLIVDQINTSLVFLSPKRSYIYDMVYVSNNTDRCDTLPDGQWIWHDYVVKPFREVSRLDNPKLFLEILKSSKKQYRHKGYRVFVDGKMVYHTTSYKKCDTMVEVIKEGRKDPDSEFKGAKRIQTIDPAGHYTWYILEGPATYNPFYSELGEEPVPVGLPLTDEQKQTMKAQAALLQ